MSHQTVTFKPMVKNWEVVKDILGDVEHHAKCLNQAIEALNATEIEVVIEVSTPADEDESGQQDLSKLAKLINRLQADSLAKCGTP